MKKLGALIIIGMVFVTTLFVYGLNNQKLTNEELGLFTDSDIMERYIDEEYGLDHTGILCESDGIDKDEIMFVVKDEDGEACALCVIGEDYFIQ